jgi:hypothetical protein
MAVGPVTAALDQCPVPPCAPLLVRGHRDGSLTISRLIPDAPQLAADEPPTASMSDGGGDSGRIRNPGRGAARQEQRHRLCAHAAGPVTCVAVVGAGTTVVSGAADGSVVFIERFDDALVLDNTSAARARCGFGGGGGGSLMPQPCSPAHARYHHELRPHWGGVASLTEIADGRIVSMGCIDGVVAVMRSAIWGEPYLSGLELFDFFFLIFFFFLPGSDVSSSFLFFDFFINVCIYSCISSPSVLYIVPSTPSPPPPPPPSHAHLLPLLRQHGHLPSLHGIEFGEHIVSGVHWRLPPAHPSNGTSASAAKSSLEAGPEVRV